MAECGLPFGKHRNEPVRLIPSDYLAWLLRVCKLSSGLRAAVVAELQARGLPVPVQPPPRPVRPCPTCPPGAGSACSWLEDRLGRRRVVAECDRCGRTVDYPPCVPPYTDMADRASSPTAALDVLLACEDLGLQLVSDGRAVDVAAADRRRAPAALLRRLRQCRHTLARLVAHRGAV